MTKQKALKLCLCILVAIVCFYVITITDYEGIYIGMDYNTAYKKASAYTGSISLGYYTLYENKWGNTVIIFGPHSTGDIVTDIRCYSSLWTNTFPSTFRQIKKGMSIFEVTALVGLPYNSETSGLPSFSYRDTLGNSYCIYFRENVREKDYEPWVVTGMVLTRRNSDDYEQII